MRILLFKQWSSHIRVFLNNTFLSQRYIPIRMHTICIHRHPGSMLPHTSSSFLPPFAISSGRFDVSGGSQDGRLTIGRQITCFQHLLLFGQ